MNSNFEFLHREWPGIYENLKLAEQRVNTEPISVGTKCRLALEEAVHHIYQLEYIDLPFDTRLQALLNEPEIRNIIQAHQRTVDVIRKTGNNATHYNPKRVSKEDAKICLKHTFSFIKWFAETYSEVAPDVPLHFNEQLIPKVGAEGRKLQEQKKEFEQERERFEKEKEALLIKQLELEEKAKSSEVAMEAIMREKEIAQQALALKKSARNVKASYEYNEAETRLQLIDLALKEAGWFELREGRELEFPVKGMPVTSDNPKGNGYVDYVLWGDDGKPLALVEAKRTQKDIEVGKHQAWLYATALEKIYNQRPIIFYTNGYEIKIWDDAFYSAPRTVYGYYTKDELQWELQKRSSRKDLRQAKVNEAIAGRPYQIEAIRRIGEEFVTENKGALWGSKRRSLLVMATGSGKTRTAAALVELLYQQKWIKRVLFLADRNALVSQAKRNFNEYLPDFSAIDLTQEKENDGTRLVFSTYPGMMNKIDSLRTDDERFYGVGHFDLIIVDEAHRSVYNRYQAIFDYFDAMLVGLTATPKNSIDHNTFELFGCLEGNPTFSYELEEAVDSKYLVDYENLDVSTKFLREGIKYSELSEAEKEKYEATFRDSTTGLFPDQISNTAMNKWLFNKSTVFQVLDELMDKGLKIEGGDELGRTIIFGVNKKHAEFIVKCFLERYPEKPSHYIAQITNGISHAESLIQNFCDQDQENMPQIAVSVDMMDTGIDAPRVLNLVFFKVVRSYAKFWQMIGRGTRFCPNIFGYGQDKEKFLIFDVCQNFEFFAIEQKDTTSGPIKPLSQQIFEARLQLSRLLADKGEQDMIDQAKEIRDLLHATIAGLDKDRFQVKMKLKYADEFADRKRWNVLSDEDIHTIENNLSDLPVPEPVTESARAFDLMMLKLQIANLLMAASEKGFHQQLINIAEELSKKYSIPQVLRSKALIESMKDPDFYKNLQQRKIEEIRTEIRELVQYLEKEKQPVVYTNLEDSKVETIAGEPIPKTMNASLYKRRVERFIRENQNLLVINKLKSNEEITTEELKQLEKVLFDGDERGTKEDYESIYGEQPLGKFIRSIIGLDIEAANKAFAAFIQSGNLSADQITFVNNIINFLTTNGTIDKAMLFEPPFTNMHDQGVLGVFDDGEAAKIISIIDRINERAEIG
ncbi:type I site-specific deoxyribonuclease [Marivirga lumbricoides]|uniref:Type I site-specific deoxyribonuclease n=1 Tax=Marivirga lumbricoides TaxID=1046115 RepID=A0A2T4DW06_9BACT|nr:type I site-specific deoxyribonuclease [Marivirga lumbricoides]